MKYINKPDKLRWAMAAVSAAMLVIMALCLSKTYAIGRQQTDTLEQIMELRQELDASSAAGGGVVPATEMTAADFKLVCRVVAAEARGEGYDGQLAVAQVIRDRSRLWGMTPAEVVQSKGQFAAPYQGEVGEDVRSAVNDCLILGVSAFDEQVTHFCEASLTPYWAADKRIVGVVGNHRFYR